MKRVIKKAPFVEPENYGLGKWSEAFKVCGDIMIRDGASTPLVIPEYLYEAHGGYISLQRYVFMLSTGYDLTYNGGRTTGICEPENISPLDVFSVDATIAENTFEESVLDLGELVTWCRNKHTYQFVLGDLNAHAEGDVIAYIEELNKVLRG